MACITLQSSDGITCSSTPTQGLAIFLHRKTARACQIVTIGSTESSVGEHESWRIGRHLSGDLSNMPAAVAPALKKPRRQFEERYRNYWVAIRFGRPPRACACRVREQSMCFPRHVRSRNMSHRLLSRLRAALIGSSARRRWHHIKWSAYQLKSRFFASVSLS